MITFPNCKINLGLFITHKRPDGFHHLQSLFLPGPLTDVLEIIPRKDHECTVQQYNASFNIPIEQHSCYKAWKLLHENFGISGVDIYLLKKIPSGAGLGGGSSDAAFTLKTLNELFSLCLNESELLQLASQLGSDDAFFIYNRPCYLDGKGHELTPLNWEFPYRIEISSPGVNISTAEAYSTVIPKAAPIDLLTIMNLPHKDWKNIITNDFQVGAISLHPTIQDHIDAMYSKGAFYAAMSGSGSSVFGLFD